MLQGFCETPLHVSWHIYAPALYSCCYSYFKL